MTVSTTKTTKVAKHTKTKIVFVPLVILVTFVVKLRNGRQPAA